jgi:hypothetical protein
LHGHRIRRNGINASDFDLRPALPASGRFSYPPQEEASHKLQVVESHCGNRACFFLAFNKRSDRIEVQ